MKNLLTFIFCLQLLFAMGACKKPPISQPPTPNPPVVQATDSSELSIVWSKNFQHDSISVSFIDPFFSGDYIVFASQGFNDMETPPADIRIFHKLTGESHSSWQHNRGSLFDRREIDDCIVGGSNQNTIFATNQLELYAFDINTRQRLWKKNLSPYYGLHRISTMGTAVLQNYGPSNRLWGRIASFDPLTGQERIVTQINIRDNYEFRIRPPAWTVNAAGDTLLLCLTGGYNFGTMGHLIDAYCYNVSQEKMEWHQKDLTPKGASEGGRTIPIIIDNNKVIFQGLLSIHCFDIGTGEEIWQYDMSRKEGFGDSPFVYYKGKLLIRGATGTLYCYDAQTGQLLWQNTAIKAFPTPWGRMDTYNDKLYFSAWGENATHHLACVDINIGEELWRDRSPYGQVHYGVIIDQQTGYLYCSTKWSIMCVDLNKTPKK